MPDARQKLRDIYRSAKSGRPDVGRGLREHLDLIVEKCESNKAVVAVLLTLMLKKTLNPEQDIRNHQQGLPGGFSGRSMDEKTVTPFLKSHNFPAMQSGSGWLTRSLEQKRPYDMNYPGAISPKQVKQAFLNIVHEVQAGRQPAEAVAAYIFAGLIEHRDKSSRIKLSRPTNLAINQIIDLLRAHAGAGMAGSARLPTLALYAVYQRLVSEVGRYKNCKLAELESHTAADSRTGRLGDIQVNDAEGRPFEAVEVKHNIALSPALVDDSYAKIQKSLVGTYYLLSTKNEIIDQQKVTDRLIQIRRQSGCQMIVNGLFETLKYYLRLLHDTKYFVDSYVALVETDPAVPYELKKEWDSITGMN